MRFITNTLLLNKELKELQSKSCFSFGFSDQWCYFADLWIGTPTDRLVIARRSNGAMVISGRGRLERAKDMKLHVINPFFCARFFL